LFEHALELDPQSTNAQLELADALVSRVLDFGPSSAADDIKRAEALSNRALAAAPRGPYAHFVKAQVLRAQRRCTEAIPEYETVLDLDHNVAGALAAIGRCKIYIGPIEEAIPLLEKAIRLTPRAPSLGFAYFRIGEAYLLQSHIDDAILWFEKAKPPFPRGRVFEATSPRRTRSKVTTSMPRSNSPRARKLAGEGSWQSIARLEANSRYEAPTIRALAEATFYAGLRKAGMPKE
jgi:tetratricopeptide (TPR) repeat protein